MRIHDEDEDKPLVIQEMDRTTNFQGKPLGQTWKQVHSRLVFFMEVQVCIQCWGLET